MSAKPRVAGQPVDHRHGAPDLQASLRGVSAAFCFTCSSMKPWTHDRRIFSSFPPRLLEAGFRSRDHEHSGSGVCEEQRFSKQLSDTRVVCTMDREADFVELFVERRERAPQVELLVRAKVDRVLSEELTAAGDQLARRLLTRCVAVPRASTDAPLPAIGADSALGGAGLDADRASTRTAAAGGGGTAGGVPAEHLPVASAADRSCTGTPCAGGSRDYFRVLKSGGKVEEWQHQAVWLERPIAIKMVVAWRAGSRILPEFWLV